MHRKLLVLEDVSLDVGLRLHGGRAPGNAGWLGAVAAQLVPLVFFLGGKGF